MDGKIVAIIQARMASTRLPGKTLADVAGRPILDRVIRRARAAKTLNLVTVATSHAATDDVVESFCRREGVAFFRGSEADVLDRYYWAAEAFEATTIVRLTADCPLLDPAVMDRVVGVFQSGDYDYVSNTHPPTFPDGLDTEVYSHEALERAWREARLPSDREHVTAFIWRQPEVFRLGNVKNETDLSALRWTVDELEDLEFIRRIYAHLDGDGIFGLDAVLELLAQRPGLGRINARFPRNEGYEKSLQADRTGA